MDNPAGTFEARLSFAKAIERAGEEWLKRRGWLVLSPSDYSGPDDDKPPSLHGAARSFVLPDTLAFRAGRARFVECKWKTAATFHRVTQRWETGIQLRHWEDYRRVRAESGVPTWIVWVHGREREMRGMDLEGLSELSPRPYDGPKMGPGGMIFFPWQGLVRLASLDAVVACMLPEHAGYRVEITRTYLSAPVAGVEA